MIPHSDYRSSHLDEGADYHRKFESHVYRAVIWEIERDALVDLLHAHGVGAQAALLDFACGTGRILQTLRPHIGSAVGVDVSESMLAVARGNVPDAEILCCDITRSDALDARRFDMITAFRFFPNAEPALRDEAMAKLAQLLAPGGILVFNNHRRSGSLVWRLRQCLRLFGRSKPSDLHAMSDAEVEELARRHGLRLVDARHAGLVPVLKERRPLLPAALLRRIERWATRTPACAPLCADRIHVLRHARPAAN